MDTLLYRSIYWRNLKIQKRVGKTIFKTNNMKKNLLYVAVLCCIVSCTKDIEEISSDNSNITSQQSIAAKNVDCEYIIENAPAPILSLLSNSDDPQEEILDTYLYHIARAYVNYSCETENFYRDYQEFEFSRYTDVYGNPDLDTEIEVEDLYNGNPLFKRALDVELTSAGLSWSTIKSQFLWHGYTYIPIIYLENGAIADWSLPPFIGIGTDVSDKDDIADFIPIFSKNCLKEGAMIVEGILGKVDQQVVNALPEPINYNAKCLKNPLLIVELGWSKNKKSEDLGDPNKFSGTTIDNPPFPPPTPSCNLGYKYYLKKGTMGGHRFERRGKSEYNLEIFSIPEGTGNIGWYPYWSRREHLRKVRKKDRNKVHGFNHQFFASTSLDFSQGNGSGGIPIGPFMSGGKLIPGHYTYAATYEYDWYAKNRNLTFDDYRGCTPKLKLRRKGSHEHYQIMTFTPPDWCENERRKFTDKIPFSEVEAK